jgi:hypothetical protein
MTVQRHVPDRTKKAFREMRYSSSLSTSIVNGGEPASSTGRFSPQKWLPGTLYIGGWIDVFGKGKNFLPLPGLKLLIVQLVA